MEFFESVYDIPSDHPVLAEFKRYVEEKGLEALKQEAKGIHPVSDTLYFNHLQYDTTTFEERDWESHKKDYDIHILFEGEERILHSFLSQMTLGDYIEDGDWQQMQGDPNSEMLLRPGNVLLLYPNDAHKTGMEVHPGESVAIDKAVFKGKIAK